MEKKLNSNHLKMIAIIAMTIDHAADILYPGFPANPVAVILHIIGRLSNLSAVYFCFGNVAARYRIKD